MPEKYILLFCLSALAPISEAGNLTYNCVVKEIYDINDAGELEISKWKNRFVGDKFSVSRETGKIGGKTLTTALAKETRVVNFGSSENSFKAIAEFDGQFQLIEIQEFKDGAKKPFIALSLGGVGVITGICK